MDNVTIPYSRFKEVTDKKNESERLLAAYRERYGDLNTQPQQTPIQQQEIPAQVQPPTLDENFAKQIDDAIKQNALKISGLSKEEIEGLDYLEDDDPKISRWNHAKRLAEAAVYQDIINNQMAQQQQIQRMAMLRNQSIADYNNYVAQQQASENFGAVQRFAENDFFNALSDLDKQVVTESYARIRNGTALPADTMIVRNFFTSAKNAFEGRQSNIAPSMHALKSKPAPNNFPRTNQVNGMTGSGGGVSQSTLEEMFNNRPWTKFRPSIRKYCLG